MTYRFHLREAPFDFESDVATEMIGTEWESKVNHNSRDYIKWLQQSLNQIMGLRLAVDGDVDPQTRSAIRSFQQQQGLKGDGIVGSITEAAIRKALGTVVASNLAADSSLGVQQRGGNVSIADLCSQSIHMIQRFRFNQANLVRDPTNNIDHPAEIETLAKRIVESWKGSAPIGRVCLRGHTDERGDQDYNNRLGLRRAETVEIALRDAIRRESARIGHQDIAAKITIVKSSLGERAPAFDNYSEDGRSRNRRVEVAVAPLTKKPPMFLLQTPIAQLKVTPLSMGPVKSRRIYVIQSPEFENLPPVAQKTASDELKAIFAFVPMSTHIIKPESFPIGVNFSDAVVSVVSSAAGVHVDQALRTQMKNAEHSLTNLGIPMQSGGSLSHRPGHPERIGLASMNKQILRSGNRSLALPLMAAAVSLEDLLDVFREEYGDDPVFKQIRDRQSRGSKNGLPDTKYWSSRQSLIDIRDLQPLKLVNDNPKAPQRWLVPTQELFGKVLGRAIAHEARHLYILQHANAGLGADSPQLLGRHFERFSDDDRKKIKKSILDWEKKQGTAAIVQTFPLTRRHLDFPF